MTDRDRLFEDAWALIEKQAPREDSGLRHILFAATLLNVPTEKALAWTSFDGAPLSKTTARFMYDHWEDGDA